jgi:hypothetical protein
LPTTKAPSAAKRFPKKVPEADSGVPASVLIDRRIAELNDWRGLLLASIRDVIRSASPDIVEEWKWNVPVWSCAGIICTGETYTKVVKLTFAKGAAIPDPGGLFNSSLEGNTRRAIDFPEGSAVNAKALSALILAARSHNKAG